MISPERRAYPHRAALALAIPLTRPRGGAARWTHHPSPQPAHRLVVRSRPHSRRSSAAPETGWRANVIWRTINRHRGAQVADAASTSVATPRRSASSSLATSASSTFRLAIRRSCRLRAALRTRRPWRVLLFITYHFARRPTTAALASTTTPRRRHRAHAAHQGPGRIGLRAPGAAQSTLVCGFRDRRGRPHCCTAEPARCSIFALPAAPGRTGAAAGALVPKCRNRSATICCLAPAISRISPRCGGCSRAADIGLPRVDKSASGP